MLEFESCCGTGKLRFMIGHVEFCFIMLLLLPGVGEGPGHLEGRHREGSVQPTV